MIVVTGAAGFIGSCLVRKLNQAGYHDIVVVDAFNNPIKNKNLVGKIYSHQVDRFAFFQWADNHKDDIQFIFHLGARTDTLETSETVFEELNLNYSKKIWKLCSEVKIPLVYASSAATYGDGKFGYVEDSDITQKLVPLNQYAKFKHQFDLWALNQISKPPVWTGLKFFNVFGPNEYHKDNMASMVYQTYLHIKKSGTAKLFKSYVDMYDNGGQTRDFIYVKDVVDLCFRLLNSRKSHFLLNVGSGKEQNFNYLVKCVFRALGKPENIEYIDMPLAIRDKYQYSTKANLGKLNGQFSIVTQNLDVAIKDYVSSYLEPARYY